MSNNTEIKSKKYDIIVQLVKNMNDNNILDTIDGIGKIINSIQVNKENVTRNTYGLDILLGVEPDFNIRDRKNQVWGLGPTVQFLLERAIRENVLKKDDVVPDIEIISKFLGVAPFVVRKSLDRLCDMGLMRFESGDYFVNDKNSFNKYYFNDTDLDKTTCKDIYNRTLKKWCENHEMA